MGCPEALKPVGVGFEPKLDLLSQGLSMIWTVPTGEVGSGSRV